MYNLEAEQALLGAVFIDQDSLLQIAEIVTAEDFYHKSHKIIFNTMLDCYQNIGTVDLISVSDLLISRGTIKDIGGISYLSEIAEKNFTTANVQYHAKIVREKSIYRKTLRWLQTMITKVQDQDFESLKNLYSELEQGIIDLSQGIQTRTAPDIKTILYEIKDKWQRMSIGEEVYIPMSDLFSSMIPYYQPGHMIAIAGYTSQGKSTLLAQLIVDAIEANAKVLGFSLEDSRHDKAIKLIANIADLSGKMLMAGHVSGAKEKINNAIEQIEKWPLVIYDDIYTIDEIRLKIKKHKLQHKIDIVFLDYIQNIQGEGTQYEILSRAITMMQKIAKEMAITFVFVSQVTNEALKANTELLGLKGAGELAAAPDIVIWVKRVKGQGKERFLDCSIRKNRPYGETGTIPLLFSENWSRILPR